MSPRSGLRVRRAGPDDAREIALVMRSAIRAARGGPYPTAVLAAWSSLPPLYHRWAMTAGGETYLVAEERGRIVAYAALRGDELTAVFVRGDLSGAGLGAKLVRQIEARARRRDVDTLRVIAAEGAVGFYARLGFSGARRAWVALPGGARLPARRMRKAI